LKWCKESVIVLELRCSDVELVSNSNTSVRIPSLYEYESSGSSKSSVVANCISLKNAHMFELNNNNSNAIKSSRYLDKGFEHDLSKKEIIHEVLLLPIYKIADDSSIINKQDEV